MRRRSGGSPAGASSPLLLFSLLLALCGVIAARLAVSPEVRVAQAQADCQFVLGFASLHDALPQVVGTCLSDEQHNPENGDALQPTSNGLLVWRKADNWTAFTDGYRTWINGPLGLQQRLNEQRFWWEANPTHLPVVPAPVSNDRCHSAGLRLSVDGVEGGAGNFVGTFRLTNTLQVPCTLYGYPGAALRDDAGNALPTRVVWGGGVLATQAEPTLARVPPGAAAVFRVHWEQVPVGNETQCPTAAALAVTPPDEYAPLILPISIHACGGGSLDVGAIQPVDPATSLTDTTTDSSVMLVKLAFIDLDAGAGSGTVGCGDRVVLVERAVGRTAAPLRAALDALLAERQRRVTSDQLYNALAAADLRVERVAIENGVATIDLSGQLSLGGVCDSPRVEAQLQETALQFPTVTTVSITLNGAPLHDALSLR